MICFAVGVSVEIMGINTGILFGDYTYGDVLGFKLRDVPVLIGVNWFIIIYCSGISIHTLLMKAINRIAADTGKSPMALKALSVIVDGATLGSVFRLADGACGCKTGLLDMEWRRFNTHL